MSKRQVIMLLGAWTMLFPFLGFPLVLKEVFVAATGLIIVLIAYQMAPNVNGKNTKNKNVPFVDYRSETKTKEPPEHKISSTDFVNEKITTAESLTEGSAEGAVELQGDINNISINK